MNKIKFCLYLYNDHSVLYKTKIFWIGRSHNAQKRSCCTNPITVHQEHFINLKPTEKNFCQRNIICQSFETSFVKK